MNNKALSSSTPEASLPRVRASDRRCPHCGSDKWVHLEGSKTLQQRNPDTGVEEKVEIPDRYGCANCAGEFLVVGALAWKRAANLERCPHCGSRRVIVAIQTHNGAILACKQCNKLGLYKNPGFDGEVTVEDVKATGKLTDEAQEFFGRRGLRFDIKRAKARRAALAHQSDQPKPNSGPTTHLS